MMKQLLFLFLCISSTLISIAQPNIWDSRGIGGGGAMFATSISPFDQKTIHIACDMSQMFKSTDFGNSWTIYPYKTLGGGNYSGHIAYTSSPQIMYTLSKQGDYTVPVKTTDGGRSWNPISDPTSGSAYYLYADPSSTTRLFMTDYTDVYLSTDGGANWEYIFSEESLNADGCYIAGALWDSDIIFIVTQGGVYSSFDNGLTFEKDPDYVFPDGVGIVSFAYGTRNNNYRLACITRPIADIFPGMTGAEYAGFDNFYTLDIINGIPGKWISKKTAIPIGMQPFFCKMSLNDPDKIYLAGGNALNNPSVIKSVNGGNTFTSIFQTPNNNNISTGWSGFGGDRDWTYGEYALGFAVSATNPNMLVVSDLGFVHTSTDGGNNWKQAYVRQADMNMSGQTIPKQKYYQSNGLENTAAWSLIWPKESSILCGNTDIKGIRSTDNGTSWQHIFNNFSFNTIYSYIQKGSTIYAATSTVHDLYQSTYLADSRIDNGKGSIIISTDNGASWSDKWNMNHIVSCIAFDATDSNTMYASVVHSTNGGIYVNNDIKNGGTWTKLSLPARTEGHPFIIRSLLDGSLVVSYSARRVGTSFTASSGVFYSTDKGKTWIDKSSNDMKYWTKDIVIDPHDPLQNTWYACVWSGWGGAPNGLGGLYRTKNRGNSWTKILELPSKAQNTNRVSSCTINPLNENEMYITTETDGLWYTADLQKDMPTCKELTNYPFRQPERVFFNPFKPQEVWITSFGNGLRVGTAASPALPIATIYSPMTDTVVLYDTNPPNITIRWTGSPLQSIKNSQIRFSTSANFSPKADTINSTEFSMNAPQFVPGSDSVWYMQIRVQNAIGWSNWTKTIKLTFRKTDDPIPVPTITLLQPKNDTIITWKDPDSPSLTISWNAIPAAVVNESQVRFSTFSSFIPKADTISFPTAYSCNLPSYVPGKDTIWYMQARASSKAGWSDWTKTIQLNFRKQSGTNRIDVSSEDIPTIYPHPVNTILNISDPQALKAEILSLQGKSLWKGLANQPIPVDFLSNGIYILHIEYISGLQSRLMFIKQPSH